jgi:hypothetical protein
MKQHRPRLRPDIAFIAVAVALLPAPTSALSVAGGGTYGTPGNDGSDAQYGPVASQTCFLSGVSGNFLGNPGLWGQPSAELRASVEIVEKNGFWVLRTRAGTGAGVMGYVTCINATAHRVEFDWSNNNTSTGVPATPNRQCFLSAVWATSGLSGKTINGVTTNLTIRKSGGQFDMDGSYVENIGGDTGWGGATARCVDIGSTAGWTFTHAGPTNGANTITLRDGFPNGPPISVPNVGCFLTGISGRWISPTPDPLGWTDGAFLSGPSFMPPASPNWQMTASNGRQGTAVCLK